ncbi:2,3-bisphosphoglycerate-independent phosphoglycerate mutase [Methanobrevibacter cuticularis]|uniref:phosphoglycerate mutase (2,3-diphosphoglycerate-independent) n=1 Tax=Methanobrevibacter cuticularis TaxID=47311 RepID=A0A166ETG9_9EURY|nr:cofactor-independent phosphoglycerate mutase [Methanobrevibacter cuticularis]KZX16994.1 2,3-bisphosphoglycerate-independent phosphoglycerate mutase [Methanobrevibacter cuticularis]
MKYVVLIGDGMSDYPLDELGGKTPLQIANIPNIDRLTLTGRAGLLENVPRNLEPASDVANMSIFGYDPQKYYSGRGPLEAGSMGVKMLEDDVAFRCNLITEENGKIADFTAGHISSKEAAIIIEDLNKHFKEGTFYPGISYRHLFMSNDKNLVNLRTTPPHDIVGEDIENYTNWEEDNCLGSNNDNKGSIAIKNIMMESQKILKDHPINQERIAKEQNPANMIWLWGQGLKPKMPNFKDVYGLTGSVITGVDLLKGLGVFTGLNNIDVPGATGYFDTDYKAKGKYASNALENNDIIFIHVEAPDEAGHSGDINEKIRAIENIDKYILGQVLDNINSYDDYKIAILPDHPTPIDVRTHTRDAVPLAIYSTTDDADNAKYYDEFEVLNGSLGLDKGHNLINKLIN